MTEGAMGFEVVGGPGCARLKQIDRNEVTWVCHHCGQKIQFTDDPIPIFRHVAVECVLLPDARLVETRASYLAIAKYSGIKLALAAPVMKHPEDADCHFDEDS